MTGIAVWGLGPHAMKNVLPAIAQAPGYTLAGVCSRKERVRAEANAKWGGASWKSPDEMLRAGEVEIVYIATPTGLHFEQGLQVLKSRKHLICEKSLTSNSNDAIALLEFAEKNELLVCEAFSFLHHPRFLRVREIIESSAFGAVVDASCAFGIPRLEAPGFRMNRELGGGALLDVGCYPLAALRGLFGEASDVLHAHIGISGHDEVDTTGEAALLFANGVRAQAVWGYNRAYTAGLFVWGEKQSLYANRLFSKETVNDSGITLRDSFGDAKSVPVPEANGFVEMFAAVDEALTNTTKRVEFLRNAGAQAQLLREVKKCAS